MLGDKVYEDNIIELITAFSFFEEIIKERCLNTKHKVATICIQDPICPYETEFEKLLAAKSYSLSEVKICKIDRIDTDRSMRKKFA